MDFVSYCLSTIGAQGVNGGQEAAEGRYIIVPQKASLLQNYCLGDRGEISASDLQGRYGFRSIAHHVPSYSN